MRLIDRTLWIRRADRGEVGGSAIRRFWVQRVLSSTRRTLQMPPQVSINFAPYEFLFRGTTITLDSDRPLDHNRRCRWLSVREQSGAAFISADALTVKWTPTGKMRPRAYTLVID